MPLSPNRFVQAFLCLALMQLPLRAEVAAQSPLVMDLAEEAGDTMNISAGDYRVRIVNRVPKYDYIVTVQRGYEAIPEIDTPVMQGMGSACGGADEIRNELITVDDEAEVPGLRRRAAAAIAAHSDETGCAGPLNRLAAISDTTTQTFETVYKLSRGEYIDVTVARREGGSKSWTRRYTTGARGRWNLSYGYAFPVLVGIGGGDLMGEGRRIRLDGDSTGFVVEETPSQPRVDMAPSVFMSFLPTAVGNWHFNLLTGGLSLDLKTPQAFLGSSVTYASNLLVTLGIGVREERVAQYEVGDSVPASLTDDQLYHDDFRLRPFFAVTYRFASNPFSGSTDTAEETPAEEEEVEEPEDQEEPEVEGEDETPNEPGAEEEPTDDELDEDTR